MSDYQEAVKRYYRKKEQKLQLEFALDSVPMIEEKQEVIPEKVIQEEKKVIEKKIEKKPIEKKIPYYKKESWGIKEHASHSWYYFIGLIDMVVLGLAFSIFGHIPLFAIPFALFGAVITIGRVQAYRKAISEPDRKKKVAFYIAWGLGAIAGTWLSVSLEIGLVNTQHQMVTVNNAQAFVQKSQFEELEQLTTNLPKWETQRTEAINKENWNTRNTLTASIDHGQIRLKELQESLKTTILFQVSARDLFGQVLGKDSIEYTERIFFILLHIFMEMILALFAKPIKKDL